MPREQINYPNTTGIVIDNKGNEHVYIEGIPLPDGSIVFTDPSLNVNWQTQNPDIPGHVQLSLSMESAYLKSLAHSLDPTVTHTAIYTPVLSRKELNKLIRVLRVARDKAYGRDE